MSFSTPNIPIIKLFLSKIPHFFGKIDLWRKNGLNIKAHSCVKPSVLSRHASKSVERSNL